MGECVSCRSVGCGDGVYPGANSRGEYRECEGGFVTPNPFPNIETVPPLDESRSHRRSFAGRRMESKGEG